MKGAIVATVEEGSIAAELGLREGDRIVGINGKSPRDLIQFQFEWAGEEVFLEVEKESGKIELFEIEKEYDAQSGVVFAQAVFDGLKVCRNRCIFCFVDQMPQGMRPSLYIKDDDYRLSFLQGSFITLTNLEKEDFDRIINEHLSPLYVSVHTTSPDLRKKMLGNPHADNIVQVMKQLSLEGIDFHTQVVLCPGWNDSEYLKETYQDLSAIKGVKSMALVPVGLTQYRDGLQELRRFSPQEARQVIRRVHGWQKDCLRKRDSVFIWPSDEFYLLAGEPLPSFETYEDFSQLENGVGLIRLFWDSFRKITLPERIEKPAEYTLATGVSGEYAIAPVIEKLNRIKGLRINCRVIRNHFFGPAVTVSGLLTAECLLLGLKDIAPKSKVLIPDVMLKDKKNRFLDDMTVEKVAKRLDVQLIPVPVEAGSILELLLGDKDGE